MKIGKKYVELAPYNKTITNLRQEIKELKNLLSEKPSDNTNAAKSALAKCTEYKHRCEEREDEINIIRKSIEIVNENLKNELETIEKYKENILQTNNLSNETKNKIENLEEKINTVDSIFENKGNLQQNIEELESLYENGEDLSNKISAIYKGIKTKKDEIESLSYEIFGYEDRNEVGEVIGTVEGLKDKLEKTYDSLTNDLQKLKATLVDIETNANSKYDDFIDNREEKYDSLVQDIEKLLPKALTASLSHAFSEKREIEIEEGEKLSGQFNWTIFALVVISLIPFGVSIYQLYHGVGLASVIKDMPRIVLSIFPLYVPVIWLAYSTSKKINLSKRLVEEYTHKEVLSKTFEGLSKQINNLEDEHVSSELRTKLLYNILSVSAENPGKLISDYNKADHPLMDALDKSAKLDDAIESIAKIPGLSKLAKILENKSTKIVKEQKSKVEDILEEVEDI